MSDIDKTKLPDDYEDHARSNESIQDGMDGFIEEPMKKDEECNGCGC